MKAHRLAAASALTCMMLVILCIAAYSNAGEVKATTGGAGAQNHSSSLQADPVSIRLQRATPTPRRRLPSELAWSPAGGGPVGCNTAPPRVENPTVMEDWLFRRILELCLYGFPENADILVTVANARGDEFTKILEVDAPVKSSDEEGEYNVTVTGTDLMWPGNVPGGDWAIIVRWEDFEYRTLIKVGTPVPSGYPPYINQTPLDFRNPLRVTFPDESRCDFTYVYYTGDRTSISGVGYPANRDIDVGIYRDRNTTWETSTPGATLDSFQTVKSDSQGNFKVEFQIDVEPGIYWIVAPPETLPEGAEELGAYFTSCFIVGARPFEDSPAPTSTSALSIPTNATVLQNSNLRAGPGTQYSRVGTRRAGAEITIVNSSPAGDWYQLNSGEWIAASLVRLANAPVRTPNSPTRTPALQTISLRPACASEIRITAGTPIILNYGIWATRGIERAIQNEDSIEITLTIDGQRISGPRMLPPIETIGGLCGRDYEDSYWIYHVTNVTLQPGTHIAQVTYRFLQPVEDGYGSIYTRPFTQSYTLIAR